MNPNSSGCHGQLACPCDAPLADKAASDILTFQVARKWKLL